MRHAFIWAMAGCLGASAAGAESKIQPRLDLLAPPASVKPLAPKDAEKLRQTKNQLREQRNRQEETADPGRTRKGSETESGVMQKVN